MKEDDGEKFEAHFSRYIKAGVEPDSLEELYKKVHANIRKNPVHKKKERSKPKDAPERFHQPKLTYDQRKQRVQAKLREMVEAADE